MRTTPLIASLVLALMGAGVLAACQPMRRGPDAAADGQTRGPTCLVRDKNGHVITCPAPEQTSPGDRCTCSSKAERTLYIGRVAD